VRQIYRCFNCCSDVHFADIVLFDEAYSPLLKCVHDTELAILRVVSRVFGGLPNQGDEKTDTRCMNVGESLQMLRHMKSLLTRESFQSDFDAKYTLIFYSFGRDIKTVAEYYEIHKSSPPIPRNMSPVAGAIMWCRQLLRRVEDPMLIFQNQRGILHTPESRKVIKLYNRVVRTLLEYEERFKSSWQKNVDDFRRGLNSPVLAFKKSADHPSQNDVVVNLDLDLLQVIKEAKHLQRLGWKIPELALVSMQQRDTLIRSYELLRFIFQRIDSETRSVPHTFVQILAPIFDALKAQLSPGFKDITWNSVNIVPWVDSLEFSMQLLTNLRRKIVETLETRVNPHISTLQTMSMVDLGNDTFTTDSFTTHIKKVTLANARRMNAMNLEVQDGINFILLEILAVARAVCNPSQMSSLHSQAQNTKQMYFRVIYSAVQCAIRNSFKVIKDKLKQNTAYTRKATFFDTISEVRPLFVVEVTLVAPDIRIRPSIKEIQSAINQSALAILNGARRIMQWGDVGKQVEDRDKNIYDEVGADLEIVKLVLVLCGSFEGMKTTVDHYLDSLTLQRKLWRDDPSGDVSVFAEKCPKVQDFLAVLSQFEAMREINDNIPAKCIIGPLLIKTAPFCQSVEVHIGLWLQHYGRLLHKIVRAQYSDNQSWTDKATAELQPIQSCISQNTLYPIDLKQMFQIMKLLGQIKLLQASEDTTFKPAEIGYNMLTVFNVIVPREEIQQLVDLRQKWTELCTLCSNVSDHLKQRESEFKKELRDFSRKFTADAIFFRAEFERKGPMVQGITIPVATERLKKFRLLFDEKNDMYSTCTNAERTFGFSVTVNNDIEKTGEELRLLSLLYDVYSEVIFRGTLLLLFLIWIFRLIQPILR
jgi:dynein heavy chain